MDDKRVPKQDMSQNSLYSEKSCEALTKQMKRTQPIFK